MNVIVGGTTTVQVCSFQAGATVSYSLNGTSLGTATADANGCATFTITASDPHLSINGSAAVAVGYGTSTLTGSGTGNNGAVRTFTIDITIPTAATPATTTATTGLAFTGADVGATLAGGLVLLVLGSLLVLVTRRRPSRGEQSQ